MDELKTKENESDWWWIDYLENELESGLESDLELLLEHSQEDRDSFENFRLLRQWVRDSDPIAKWPLEDRLTRMRSKIMEEVLKTEPSEKPRTKAAQRPTNSLRT